MPNILVHSLLLFAILITAVYKASLITSTLMDHRLNPYILPAVSRLEHSSLRASSSSRVKDESIISNASFDLPSFLNLLEKEILFLNEKKTNKKREIRIERDIQESIKYVFNRLNDSYTDKLFPYHINSVNS